MHPAATCLICHRPRPLHQPRLDKLCGHPVCLWKHQNLPAFQRCSVCGRLLTAGQLATRMCDDAECLSLRMEARRRDSALRHEQERQALEARRGRAAALRDATGPAIGIREPATYPLAVIPWFPAAPTPLPMCRKQAFAKYVGSLADEVMSSRAPPGNDDAATGGIDAEALASSVVLNRACALCRGHCCRDGGEDAYLTAETLRRYLANHTLAGAAELADAYVSRIGETTCEGSCVFHGPSGCTLTRGMRSDVCNDFYCRALKSFQREHGTDPPRGFFAQCEAAGEIRTAAFADRDVVREVPVRPGDTASAT